MHPLLRPASPVLPVADPAASPPLRLPFQVIRRRADFARLRHEWDRLLAHADRDWPFLSWSYLDAAWNRFCSDGEREAVILCYHSDTGRLCGGLPLMIGRPDSGVRRHFRHLSFLGMRLSQTGDWHSVIAVPGAEREVASGFAEIVAGSFLGQWHVLSMMPVPADCSVSTRFFDELRSRGLPLRRSDDEPAPYIHVADGWEAVHRRLDRKLRKNLRNARRKVESRHELRFLEGGVDIDHRHAVEEIQRIHHLRWGYSPDLSGKYDLFHDDIASIHIRRNGLFSLLLQLDGRNTAGLFGYVYRNKFWGVMIGRDPAYPDLSLGSVLLREALERVCSLGMAEFDFLGGGGEYKRRWATGERSFVRYTGYHPRRLRGIAFGRGMQVKRWTGRLSGRPA